MLRQSDVLGAVWLVFHCRPPKAQLTERISYLEVIEQENVATMVDTACVEITDKGAYVENADGKQFIEADTVIICVGTKALAEERDKFIDVAFDVINVGDCVKASSIVQIQMNPQLNADIAAAHNQNLVANFIFVAKHIKGHRGLFYTRNLMIAIVRPIRWPSRACLSGISRQQNG